MKRKIGLLATARKKASTPSAAIDLYISPLFVKSVQYAQNHYDDFFFFSAKEGLVTKDQYIEPYNVSIKNFTTSEKREWAHHVIQDLEQNIKPSQCKIYIHGGWVYREFLQPALERAGFQFEVPLEGYSIGNQLKWYDEQNQVKK
ncbi:DUF6884 domain-containing protein [Fictibacillus phosphorivorans]|uniref:Uncharacterized protein n=1 Tax=Fictibacillus phosphorivorans TaxID=1221500 RepID=A0A161IJE6_9BACL|nr:DUF6884 domain-containing protein [Fictibacillus phosphorivorans]ANC78209.1 hypothetical protein ABE65_015945 [Fictibacillus phosphorivorans]MQR95214.1 hypothetical protein [Fictibacillus phosphorivorans]